RDRGVQAEGALGVLLVPGVAAVRADEGLRGERVPDLRAAAAGALVQPVVTAGAGVDDAVRGAPTGGLVPLVGPLRRLPLRRRPVLGRAVAVGGGRTGRAGRGGPAGWAGRACSGPCGGPLITLLGARSQPGRGLLRRLVVRFGDQALVEHLLVLGELRDRIGRSGLGGRRLLRGRLLGGLLLGRLLLRGLLAGRGPGLGLADHAAGGSHARPEHRQSRAAAVLAGGLHTARGGLVHEGLRAGAGERVGLLHVLEQLAGVLVVLDRDDRGLHDREAAIAGPAVVLLHRGRERLGEAHRVALDAGDAVALVGIVRVAGEGLREGADDLLEQLTARLVVHVAEVEHRRVRGDEGGGHEVVHEQQRIDD